MPRHSTETSSFLRGSVGLTPRLAFTTDQALMHHPVRRSHTKSKPGQALISLDHISTSLVSLNSVGEEVYINGVDTW